MKNIFSKEHTMVAKGIAICMMLYHHLFVIPERISCDYTALLDIIFPNAQHYLAVMCKMCVCIYVFLSGYGLYRALSGKTFLCMCKQVCIRILKFMLIYVVVYVLFVPVGMFTGYYQMDIAALAKGIFGLGNISGFNNTWWFVNVYITILLIVPFIVKFLDKGPLVKRITAVLGIFLIYGVNRFVNEKLIVNYFYVYYLSNMSLWPVMMTLFVGCVCGRYPIYEKMLQFFDKIQNVMIRQRVVVVAMSLMALSTIAARMVLIKNATDMKLDFIIVPIFVFSAVSALRRSRLWDFLIILGKHSTVMWLSHAFLCYTYAQKIVFLPFYSELVFVWFLVLSFCISIVIYLVLIPINNLLFSDKHRLSFRGYSSLFRAR